MLTEEIISRQVVSPQTVSPEIMTLIAETVAATCGKQARIRSVRKIDARAFPQAPSSSSENQPWVQEGRVLIHTSHELVQVRTTAAGQRSHPSLRGVLLEAADCD